MGAHTEATFEAAIEANLTSFGGYQARPPSAYDETLALFLDDVIGFLLDSQATR